MPETANKWVFLLFLVFILSLLFPTIITVLRKKDKVFFSLKHILSMPHSASIDFSSSCAVPFGGYNSNIFYWLKVANDTYHDPEKFFFPHSPSLSNTFFFFQTAFQNVCLHRLFSFYLNGNKQLPLLCPFINNELSLRRNDRLPNKNIWKKKTQILCDIRPFERRNLFFIIWLLEQMLFSLDIVFGLL